MILWSTDEIAHPVHAVDEVNVDGTRLTKHGSVTRGLAAARVGGEVVKTFVGFGLGDFYFDKTIPYFMDKVCTEKIGGDEERGTVEK